MSFDGSDDGQPWQSMNDRLSHRQLAVNDFRDTTRKPEGGQLCTAPLPRRSFAPKLACAMVVFFPTKALAQIGSTSGDADSVSLGSVQDWVAPAADLLAYPIFFAASVWQYLMTHPAAAVLLSSLLAAVGVFRSISHQRRITRLRETFATMNEDNWDKDVIEARTAFASIKKEMTQNGSNIATLSDHSHDHTPNAITLQTIMNDYENVALGIRHGILDETYLFRWMRSTLIRDWNTVSPLVTAYRQRFESPNIYIEFEGLSNAWMQNRSYATGRSLKKAVRRLSVR